MRSTIDHIYVLLNILKQRKMQRKDTYVCYVDFARAFDCVDHDLLKLKMLQNGIDGKIYKAICAMYSNMSASIRLIGFMTDSFTVESGVKKGDNLSPTLFALFINDLIKDINNLGFGITYGDVRVSILAYADDLVLMAESEAELQEMLDALNQYCVKWRLSVNGNKTQIMHFRIQVWK